MVLIEDAPPSSDEEFHSDCEADFPDLPQSPQQSENPACETQEEPKVQQNEEKSESSVSEQVQGSDAPAEGHLSKEQTPSECNTTQDGAAPEAEAKAEEPTTPLVEPPEAQEHKAEGNEHFKEKRYDEAIECYSRALEVTRSQMYLL